jgi:hypothetical protein
LNKELAAKIHHSGASYGEDRAAVSEWKTIIYRIQKQISGFFLLVCVCCRVCPTRTSRPSCCCKVGTSRHAHRNAFFWGLYGTLVHFIYSLMNKTEVLLYDIRKRNTPCFLLGVPNRLFSLGPNKNGDATEYNAKNKSKKVRTPPSATPKSNTKRNGNWSQDK